jgi:hypothetical protein
MRATGISKGSIWGSTRMKPREQLKESIAGLGSA